MILFADGPLKEAWPPGPSNYLEINISIAQEFWYGEALEIKLEQEREYSAETLGESFLTIRFAPGTVFFVCQRRDLFIGPNLSDE